MKQLKSSDILKEGVKLKATKVDFNSPEIQRQLEQVKKEIQEVLDNAKIDYSKLPQTFCTI